MDSSTEMRVVKRDGSLEDLSFDKILRRIRKLGQEAKIQINYQSLVMKVIDQLYDTIPTSKIDELAAEQCAVLSTNHPDYAALAGRIVVSNHQKNTEPLFSVVMKRLYNFIDMHGVNRPILAEDFMQFVNKYEDELNKMIVHDRDYYIDYFGFKTLERAYLFRLENKVIVERPQHMWLRVAVGIHGDMSNPDALKLVKETYDLMSQKYFTHATPTLFNAGTQRPQMSSCYLLAMEDDSIDGIFNTLKDCARISKWAGGVGLHIHNIRAKGTHIVGTNGTSNGIVPMLRVFNNTARYVDQCVHPETIIYTDKGPIQIQHCSSGETKIFNLKGNCEVIENVLEHPYDGEMLNIETMHCIDNLRITPEHPLFVLRDEQSASFEWIDAKDLTLDDMLVYSIPNYSVDSNSIVQDDCYMYGVILGNGTMHNNEQTGTISSHKKHVIDFTVKYFENKCVYYKLEQNANVNTTKIIWNKNINMPFRYSDVYDMNKEKHMHHKWLNLPIHKSKFILKGLLESAGCWVNNKEFVFDNASRNLIESVRFICLKLGLLTTGYHSKYGYCLRIPKTKEICDLMNIHYDETTDFGFFKFDNYLLSKVKNITREQYSGTVYDLQMKDEHNYMLHNGLVHNGGGKRNGSFAIYLEPWHADVEDFLEMKKNHGDEELKGRDLFYALWVSDLFMERVKNNGKWSLMCPHECPGLSDVYGVEFVALYEKYEEAGKVRKTVNARDLWFKILDAQMETGTPYLLYKDAANAKSNQKNLGTIKSSNLCVSPETLILTDRGHIEIQSLKDQVVNIWNGEEWSEVTVKKTGEDQNVIRVRVRVNTNDYRTLRCTPYHKFYIIENNQNVEIRAMDLKLGMRLIGYNKPTNISEENTNYTIMSNYEIAIIDCVEDLNEKCDTYCFTEPKRHMGIFNGIITGQCTEIIEYSNDKETAVCNLASIALPTFVNPSTREFDYEKLHYVVKVATNNLNKVIDVNFYPTKQTERSNMKHRPIGLGVQGLADTFVLMDIPFHSTEALEVNKLIFETIYHAALEQSNEIAIMRKHHIQRVLKYIPSSSFIQMPSCVNEHEYDGIFNVKYGDVLDNPYLGTYSSFATSPAARGILQFDMWNVKPTPGRYDWDALKQSIQLHGLRNSLLVAPMPTASTSQILGFNECFEPFTSNLYSRRTLAGEFVVVNKYLMKELIELGHWNEQIKNNIIANKGSIQQLTILPEHIRNKYKIVWEIPMRHVIDMAADRGAFICQSQSLNLWVEDPTYNTLTSMHFYSWKKGLKTGIYYLRRKAKHQAQQFTIEPEQKQDAEQHDEICEMCSA